MSQPDFNEPNNFANNDAPDAWVSFLIGGVFAMVANIYYYFRVRHLQKQFQDEFYGSLKIRGMISAAIDVDDPGFTITKLCSLSFFFLGSMQLDYQYGVIALLGATGILSSLDIIRVLLAFREVDSLTAYTATSRKIQRKTRNTTELKPRSVYEDLTRRRSIVFMVFITQCILIAFVIVDIYDNKTRDCFDGTSGCPIVGTLESYALYVLGIFMASVFVLGPKTSFGQNELNPAYWLKLLLFAKTGAKVTWFDPTDELVKSRILKKNDWRIWYRFFFSWLINGVGFHILFHALPIQVAGQSSYTSVVFRAVGMLYLVDLDDSPGYTMTLVEDMPETKTTEPLPQIVEGQEFVDTMPQIDEGSEFVVEEQVESVRDNNKFDEGEISVLAQKIIADAKSEALAQLDALLAGGINEDFIISNSERSQQQLLAHDALALVGAPDDVVAVGSTRSIPLSSRPLSSFRLAAGGAQQQETDDDGAKQQQDGDDPTDLLQVEKTKSDEEKDIGGGQQDGDDGDF